MKIYFCLITLSLGLLLNAQNQWNAGLLLGSSNITRSNSKESYFDYSNQEMSFFVGKNFEWKNNEDKIWKKFWLAQINTSFGKYTLSREATEQKTYAAQINAGIKFERKITNQLNFESSIILGGGFHTELKERLSRGIYFREAIIVGINKEWNSGFKNQIGLGFQHASNANIYSLNRGYELFFLRLGILWNNKNH